MEIKWPEKKLTHTQTHIANDADYGIGYNDAIDACKQAVQDSGVLEMVALDENKVLETIWEEMQKDNLFEDYPDVSRGIAEKFAHTLCAKFITPSDKYFKSIKEITDRSAKEMFSSPNIFLEKESKPTTSSPKRELPSELELTDVIRKTDLISSGEGRNRKWNLTRKQAQQISTEILALLEGK